MSKRKGRRALLGDFAQEVSNGRTWDEFEAAVLGLAKQLDLPWYQDYLKFREVVRAMTLQKIDEAISRDQDAPALDIREVVLAMDVRMAGLTTDN